MDGKVVTISPDTIQDERQARSFYYRVFIRTDADTLKTRPASRFRLCLG